MLEDGNLPSMNNPNGNAPGLPIRLSKDGLGIVPFIVNLPDGMIDTEGLPGPIRLKTPDGGTEGTDSIRPVAGIAPRGERREAPSMMVGSR